MTTPVKPEIARAYDNWSRTYDADPNATRDLALAALKQAGLNLADRHVFEIGCGTGRNTEWLIEQGAQVTALDFSAEMLAKAKARVSGKPAQFFQHDIQTPWPLADAAGDAVIIILVLEHIPHLKPIFAEAFRTLRPGGTLWFCELHPMRQMTGKQAEYTNAETGEREPIPAYLHDLSEYVNTGLAAGFHLVRLDEWRDEGAQGNELPRVVSFHFQHPTSNQ